MVPALAVHGLGIGSVRKQELHALQPTAHHGRVQGRETQLVRPIYISAALETEEKEDE